jgi:hypothetical protein
LEAQQEETIHMPRTRRYQEVFATDAAALVADATKLCLTSRNAKDHLVPFCEQDEALNKLNAEIRVALNIIEGRATDHEEPWLRSGGMPGPGK